MGETPSRQPLSFAEKASMSWLVLFSIAAFISQILLWQGKQAVAIPEQAYLPPFTSVEHLLGTDQLGRDVLYYLFLSCRTAWLLAVPPLIVATAIGVLFGSGAAILGNNGVKITVRKLLTLALLLVAYLVLHSIIRYWPPLSDYPFTRWLYYGSGILLLCYVLNRKPGSAFSKKRTLLTLPVDEGLQKIIDLWSTLPKLLLLLILTAFTPFSMLTLMGWITATYWVLPARIARASVLQLKKGSYYETAQALGIPFNRVFTHFILPSLKGPILTNFCFAASGLLGVGSTLAYLGIGIPADVPSWGKMLANARFSVEAWWLLVFPAALLLGSIFSLQVLGHSLSAQNRDKSVTK
ncbi:ABC transporter permease [Rufibacter sp. XAAS-G3-1]|uniref:ABC transporter permease n=1 Tax=Rufibacter sp. XAAS-G3-1 TaxID=2729134 RepID=UPI0015E7127A|nr:ABC transporter permease subunit [Rufibacter sp. XAAS-G3-1]